MLVQAWASFAVDSKGDTWAWGRAVASMGLDPAELTDAGVTCPNPGWGTCIRPRKLTTLPKVARISTGYASAIALTTTGQVLVWGNNDVGQLGNVLGTGLTPKPMVGLP